MAQEPGANGGKTNAPTDIPEGMPVLQIVSQYVKDLSFENPSMGINVQRPQIDFTVDLQARRLGENAPFEVLIKLRVTAQQEEKTLFLLELAYGGLFILDKIPEEAMQPMLLIECPRLMFPYVRRIISDIISDGGLPPLMIEPIDFAALYRSRMSQAGAQTNPTLPA
ncbi:MAG TPA: protein-export chaperone SecB [Micropepsaceae bacterium]|nr:protein-export chaperone SecB [Micropepsaceae bacterium]